MNTVTTSPVLKGAYVLVEVLGLPGSTTEEPTFVYRAHADLEVGEQVQLPAPDWSIRVTGRESLPGYVLGAATALDMIGVPVRKIRDTMPAGGSESHANGFAPPEATETLAAWRKQAAAFSEASRAISEAADALERAVG